MENTLNKTEQRTILALSIYDKKAEQYLPPFFAYNEQLAIRTLKDILNNPQSPMSKHPRRS